MDIPKKFTHLTPPELPELIQVNPEKGDRYYTRNKDKFPSVTSVLNIISRDGIQRWKDHVGEEEAERISKSSMKIGTKLHSMIEDTLNNEPFGFIKGETNYEHSPLELYESISPLIHKINNISVLEEKLFSKELKLAGTTDCIAEYDGVRSIIDFKNSRKKKFKSQILKYFIQATCYSIMWEELTGEKIDQIVILVASWDGKAEAFIEKRENFINKMWTILIQYEKEQYLNMGK